VRWPRVPIRILPLVLRIIPLLASPGCASHDRERLPTLEDYSDGTSIYVETLHTQWTAGRLSPDLFAAGFRWAGPLPGERLVPVPARPPLSLAVFRSGSSGPRPAAEAAGEGLGGFGAPVLASRLEAIRADLVSLGRTEATIFDFHRRGDTGVPSAVAERGLGRETHAAPGAAARASRSASTRATVIGLAQ